MRKKHRKHQLTPYVVQRIEYVRTVYWQLQFSSVRQFSHSFAHGTIAYALKRVVLNCSLHSLQTTHSLSDSRPMMVHRAAFESPAFSCPAFSASPTDPRSIIKTLIKLFLADDAPIRRGWMFHHFLHLSTSRSWNLPLYAAPWDIFLSSSVTEAELTMRCVCFDTDR